MLENTNTQTNIKNNQNEVHLGCLEEALKQKYNALLEEIKNIDNLISELQAEYSNKLESLYSNKKTYEETLNHISALLKIEHYSCGIPKISNINDTHAISITDAVYNILQDAHCPLHYKDITNRLIDQGIYISGVNASATLLSRISRDERFKRVKRGTYGLKGWRKITNRKKTKNRRNNF
jgi:hypothetical protein